MSAQIHVFPVVKNPTAIRRTARFMMTCNPRHAENHLCYAVKAKVDGMIKRGIPDGLAREQGAAYQAAIRAYVWRLTLLGDSPARRDDDDAHGGDAA